MGWTVNFTDPARNAYSTELEGSQVGDWRGATLKCRA